MRKHVKGTTAACCPPLSRYYRVEHEFLKRRRRSSKAQTSYTTICHRTTTKSNNNNIIQAKHIKYSERVNDGLAIPASILEILWDGGNMHSRRRRRTTHPKLNSFPIELHNYNLNPSSCSCTRLNHLSWLMA